MHKNATKCNANKCAHWFNRTERQSFTTYKIVLFERTNALTNIYYAQTHVHIS